MMPSFSRLLRAARVRGLDGPRAALAVRAAVAAALAWLVVVPMGGLADEYPYYAPFGAVIAVTGTVAVSLRASAQAVAAILLGSVLALGFAATPLPGVVSLALAVGVGTLLAGWKPIRPGATWVPGAAVFVMVLGGSEPWEFASGYFLLTALGAAVGAGVDLAWPALPWHQTHDTLRDLRERLADQLAEMADALSADNAPTPDDWVRSRAPVVGHSVAAEDAVVQADSARRGNWRARGWDDVPDTQHRRADTLRQLAVLVQDLRTLLEWHEHRDVGVAALGPSLRWPAAVAIRSVADVVRTATDDEESGDAQTDSVDEEHREVLDRAVEAIRALEEEVRRSRGDEQADLFAASSTVTALWRMVSTLTPPDLRSELVPGW